MSSTVTTGTNITSTSSTKIIIEKTVVSTGNAAVDEEFRECRCMFCGQLLKLKSESEAIEHMTTCMLAVFFIFHYSYNTVNY